MFTEPRTSLRGRHYTVTDVIGLPKPVQQPHPPILIGGTGERVLLKLVAKHADMYNASAGADRMRHLIEVIGRHGDALRRDTTAIEHTVMIPLAYKADPDRQQFMCSLIAGMRGTSPEEARQGIMIGEQAECLDTIERYRRVGVTHFIFMLFQPIREEEIQAFAEDVIPAVRGPA
jgi:alkanesulfonate monooxygenase SsuD/methylene tetrahydromethanopterin reductase-like flavin-dependent oxidoreductase (luciferase family)